jgi:hypothetical protein
MRAFTIIEMLISIILFSLLFLAMQNLLKVEKSSLSSIKRVVNSDNLEEKTIKVLYNDILTSTNQKIICKSKDFCRLYLKSRNSLYDNVYPYIFWYVSKQGNYLIRIESYKEINETFIPQIYDADRFLKLTKFKIYQNKNKFFVYLKKGKKSIFFELVK